MDHNAAKSETKLHAPAIDAEGAPDLAAGANAERTDGVKQKTALAAKRTAEAAGVVKQKTAEAAEVVKQKTSEAAGAVKQKTTEAASAVKQKTTEAAGAVKQKTAEAARNATSAARKGAEVATSKAKDTYEKFVERLSVELKDAGKLRKKQWDDAVSSALDFMHRAKPEVKREDLDGLGDTVKKDVRHALRSFRARGEEWTRSESFLTARDKGAQFLLGLASRVKDAAEAVETNLEETLTYHAGEVVSGGRFVCVDCTQELTLEQSGSIPACALCGKADFKRKA